ncbi:hypothetical protein F8M41_011002 [Gigaspora margarita]|uniref:Uncharacterized protein n=1 Tax=Gigaspora margarita TaxID=4874 RepID=A0A8H3WZZ6_GIGMA|nr:hypothetical protein F8M41_011002 [Gigaspora margarita]
MDNQQVLFNKIVKKLIDASSEKFHPVHVPMIINNSWKKCYYQTYKLYKEAKIQKNHTKILAYSYHLGSLVLAYPNQTKVYINPKSRKAWIRTYHLFKTIGYNKIYQIQKLKLKYIYYLDKETFKKNY